MSTGINNNIDCKLQGKVRVVVMEKDKIIHDTGEIKNMITNQGMDEVANRPFAELFACCAIGTGTADTVCQMKHKDVVEHQMAITFLLHQVVMVQIVIVKFIAAV